MSMSLTRSCSFSHHDSSRINHSHPSHFKLRTSKQRATEAVSSRLAEVKNRKLLRMSPAQGHKAAAISPGTLINTNNVSLTTPSRVKEVLRRPQGQGQTSHTNHSLFQRAALLNVKHVLEDNLRDLYRSIQPECLKFADLGCSSLPNAAFSPLWVIAETVRKESLRLGQRPPAIQAFLNHLPRNDLNNTYLKPDPKEDEFGPCFLAGVSGSLHGRLFPDNSIHLFHSSFTINWLSQVPKRLDGRDMNKGNIMNSPIRVQGAYSTQFESDFINFLNSRAKEIKPGGRMVIAMMGSNDNKGGHNVWELLGITLNELVSEGLVGEAMLDSFNLPLHCPCIEEVRVGILKEGSFRLLRLETLRTNWDGESCDNVNRYDNIERGKLISMALRDAGESVLAAHFGLEITDALFRRHSCKVADYLDSIGEGVLTMHVVSLIKD